MSIVWPGVGPFWYVFYVVVSMMFVVVGMSGCVVESLSVVLCQVIQVVSVFQNLCVFFCYVLIVVSMMVSCVVVMVGFSCLWNFVVFVVFVVERVKSVLYVVVMGQCGFISVLKFVSVMVVFVLVFMDVRVQFVWGFCVVVMVGMGIMLVFWCVCVFGWGVLIFLLF